MIRATLVLVLRGVVSTDWAVVRSRINAEWRRLEQDPDFVPPVALQRLLVSGEDHRCLWHPGCDPAAICRALWRRVARGSREGASTIEQQVVRTITGRYERTLRRKLREVVLAVLVAAAFPKSVLPAVYLGIAYYGWRMNGYRQACMRLRLGPRTLSLDDAAALVARLKYPEPRVAPIARRCQIDRRRRHLIALYRRHSIDGTYGQMYGPTVHASPITLDATHSIPRA